MAFESTITNTNGSQESNIFAVPAFSNTITIDDDTTTSTERSTTITPSSPLLDLPPEIRKMIWSYVLQGGKSSLIPSSHSHLTSLTPTFHLDSTPIHVDHMLLWRETEWCTRLNLTLVNKQIRSETTTSSHLFHALNTFVFAASDRLKNYRKLENVAEWLASHSEPELQALKRVVVCTTHSKEVLAFAWQDAGYCGMDSGFVVGERIDKIVSEDVDRIGRKVNRVWEAWGREEGHFCNKAHFELVRKEKRKGKGRK